MVGYIHATILVMILIIGIILLVWIAPVLVFVLLDMISNPVECEKQLFNWYQILNNKN